MSRDEAQVTIEQARRVCAAGGLSPAVRGSNGDVALVNLLGAILLELVELRSQLKGASNG